MNRRSAWQFGIGDLFAATLCAAIGAWTVRDLDYAPALLVLVWVATFVAHAVAWLSVVRDIRASRLADGQRKTAKVLMAVCGGFPWDVWLVFAVWYGTAASKAVIYKDRDGVLDVAAPVLSLSLVITMACSLAAIGYSFRHELPTRYLVLAGLNILLAMVVFGLYV